MEARKILDSRIRNLKKLEEDQKAAQKKADILEYRRKKFLETLFENPIRMMEVTKEIIQLREKALKHEAIKSLLVKHHIPIEDVALVDDFGRMNSDIYIGQLLYGPAVNSWSSIFKDTNDWFFRQRYIYGGPKDRVKIFFRTSKNNQYYFCGFIADFPIKANLGAISKEMTS